MSEVVAFRLTQEEKAALTQARGRETVSEYFFGLLRADLKARGIAIAERPPNIPLQRRYVSWSARLPFDEKHRAELKELNKKKNIVGD